MISTFLIFLAAAIFVLGPLVVVHELGHFLAAKRLGVQVFEFAVGFGRVVFERLVNGTHYRLRAFPFGGFVHMRGENPEEDEVQEEVAAISPYEDPRSLASKTVFQRFQVYIGGPLMNLLTAMALVVIVSLVGTHEDAYKNEPALAAWVYPESSAAKAGVLPGDILVRAGETTITTWEEFEQAIGTRAGSPTGISVRRGDDVQSMTITTEARGGDDGAIYGGILPNMEAEVAVVMGGGAAEKAGMRAGDTVATVGGVSVRNWPHLIYLIQQNAGKDTTFLVRRAGEHQPVPLTVNPIVDSSGVAKIGIQRGGRKVRERFGLGESLVRGVTEPYRMSAMVLGSVVSLITGKQSVSGMGGPIMIAQAAGNVATQYGLWDLLHFMAFISINFFVLNLLPFPVLDGGHIMFLIPEIFTGKVVSMKVRGYAQLGGVVLLVSFMLFVTIQDVNRLSFIRRLLGW